AQAEREGLAAVAGSSQAALHSKILVVDRTEVVVGSFNLDPRSLNINTEMGMVIKSASLTGEVVDFVRTGMQLSNSYQLQLDGQQLVWLTANGEHQVVHRAEPEVGLWARFKTWLVAWLPIKHQL